MNRPCPHSDLLNPYMDGELPEEKRRFVEDHLESCLACADEFQNLRKLRDLLMDCEEVSVSPDFDRLFWKKVDAFEEKKLKNAFRRWLGKNWRLGFAPVFATAVLLIGTTFVKDTRTMMGRETMFFDQMELFQDFDVVNNLDLLEDVSGDGDLEGL